MLFETLLQAHNGATDIVLLWNAETDRGYYICGGPGETPDVNYIADWNFMNFVYLALNQLDSTCNSAVDYCDSFLYERAYEETALTFDQLALLKKGTM